MDGCAHGFDSKTRENPAGRTHLRPPGRGFDHGGSTAVAAKNKMTPLVVPSGGQTFSRR